LNPRSAEDKFKIVFFFVLIIPGILYAALGLIPAAILLFGFLMMRKNRDFSIVEISIRICNYYFAILLSVATIVVGFIWYEEYSRGYANNFNAYDMLYPFIIFCTGVAVCFHYLIYKHLYLIPLRNHSEWVKVNGLLSDSTKPKNEEVKQNPIIKGKYKRSDKNKNAPLTEISVADELMKWVKLRDSGAISEDQFEDARITLMKRF
jgi:hypothetical protein